MYLKRQPLNIHLSIQTANGGYFLFLSLHSFPCSYIFLPRHSLRYTRGTRPFCLLVMHCITSRVVPLCLHRSSIERHRGSDGQKYRWDEMETQSLWVWNKDGGSGFWSLFLCIEVIDINGMNYQSGESQYEVPTPAVTFNCLSSQQKKIQKP